MKKDIEIPEVEGVYLAVVREYNEIFKTEDWYVYLLNQNNHPLEIVLLVSSGKDGHKETSVMRHKIDLLPANSFAKVELVQEEILKLNNRFQVTFFQENKMFEKTFELGKNVAKEGNLRFIEILGKRGVLLK